MLFRSKILSRPTSNSRWSVWGVFSIAHIAIFAGLFRGVYSMPFSGTGLFYSYAGKTLAGGLPYRDFALEYPPLALIFFTIPRVLGESFRWYYVWFQTEVIVFDLIVVAALFVAARRWTLQPVRVLIAYTIAVLAVGPITLHQFDLFSATFLLLAVIAFADARTTTAAVFLALGTMTKVYPILVAPLFVLVEWRRGRMKELWRSTAAFVITCVTITLPWLVLAPKSLGVFFRYHANRGIHIDSTYGTIALAAHSILGATANVVFAFASWNLAGPVADGLARLSTWILFGALVSVYVVIDRVVRIDPDRAVNLELLSGATTLVIAAALPASKVLSPQYLIWLMPTVALIGERHRNAIFAIFAATGVLTYFMYPLHYDDFLARFDWAVAAMLVRNALLVVLAVVIAKSLREPANHVQNQRI